MAAAGGNPNALADVTPRMAVFGRLFGDALGGIDPGAIPHAEALMELLQAHMPTRVAADDEAPVFEAAAFVGEWIRARVPATWLADGPHEPHLQASDESGSIIYLIPLVGILRTAVTAGYDGLAPILDGVVSDVAHPPERTPLRALRVRPARDATLVIAWANGRRAGKGSSATLWRRCSTCSTLVDESITNLRPPRTWEHDAAKCASVLAEREFHCACGGMPGEVSRFLMVRTEGDEKRLADIYVAGTFTRIACWTIVGDEVEPYDAGQLAVQM